MTPEQQDAIDAAFLRALDPPMCSHGCCTTAVCEWVDDCATHQQVAS